MERTRIAAFTAGLMALSLASAAPKLAANNQAEAPAEIPFILERDHIVVDVVVAPGQALPFIFDSGLSAGNVLTVETAIALDLKPEGEARYRDSSGSGGGAKTTSIPSIRVGNATLGKQTYAVTRVPDQLTEREDENKPPIAGFLGAPLMQDAVLCIDYRHRVMHRFSPRSAFKSAGYSSIPMPLNHGLPTIALSIDQRKATVVIDSGNSGGLGMFPVFADKNDLRKRYPDMTALDGLSGSGASFEVLSGIANTVEIERSGVLRKVPLSLIPQSFDPKWEIDGLAGFAVLSRLNPCLDRDGGKLFWKAAEVDRK